ncbi:MAG: hypothetical protein H0U42_05250 [Thermoleophilaceae bacterium]|nr:hypothetical protein [Thermoleophilaceae bacterium]
MSFTSLRQRAGGGGGRGSLLGSGREVGKPQRRSFLLIVGALGLIFALLLLYVGFNAANSIPGKSYFYLNGEFEEADNIAETYQIRKGAELVGQVSSFRVEDGKSIVELQLNGDQRGEILSDTTLRVRPRSPIGVRFIELTPGTEGEPLEEGAIIRAAQTESTVPLDEALSALDRKARDGFGVFLKEAGKGFAGRGQDLNATLAQGPQTLDDLESVAGAVNERNGAFSRFIRSTEGAAAAAEPVREQIATGFDPEARALRPFSDAGDALQETLVEAPPTLASVRNDLAASDPLVRETRLLAQAAEPTLEQAEPALRNTADLLEDSRPPLRDLDSTLRLAERAVTPTLGLLDTVDPVLPNIDEALKDALPIVDELAPRGCDYTRFFENWQSMLGFSDGDSNFIRFELIPTEESTGAGGESGAENGGEARTPTFSNAYPEPCEAGSGTEPTR